MSDEIKVTKTLDLKGLACPMPVVKISKGIKDVAVGEVIEAHTTDKGSLTDIPAWGRTTGHEIVEIKEEGDLFRFFIRRTS
nr:sulfurtransferase TusA family protein [uncultured Desulfobacter sp.]